jgi:hypothetical protein
MIIHSTTVEFTTGHFSCQAKKKKNPLRSYGIFLALLIEDYGRSECVARLTVVARRIPPAFLSG